MAKRLLALSFCVHMLFTTKVTAHSLLRSELCKKNFQSFRSWPPRRSESLAHCCSRCTACIMPSEAEQAKWRLQHISSYSCAQAIDILTNTCTCIQHCLWGSNTTAISSGRHQSSFSCVSFSAPDLNHVLLYSVCAIIIWLGVLPSYMQCWHTLRQHNQKNLSSTIAWVEECRELPCTYTDDKFSVPHLLINVPSVNDWYVQKVAWWSFALAINK